jgi:hypothetical protein
VSGERLPVDLERLRREFPALTPDDVDAYVAVTRRIMGASPDARGRVAGEAVAGGRRAREKAARGEPLGADEALFLRYLDAVGKMQRKAPSAS